MYADYKKKKLDEIKEKEDKIKEVEDTIDSALKERTILLRDKRLQEQFIVNQKQSINELKKEIEFLTKEVEDTNEVSKLLDLDLDIDISDVALLNRNKSKNNEKHIETPEDLILIYSTDCLPINGVINSDKETPIFNKSKFNIEDKEYEYEYESGSDILHSCLNRIDINTSDKKYGILIPLSSVDKSNIVYVNINSIYSKSKVKVSDDSIIICPKEEKENIRKNNPNIRVIGYDESISLDNAVHCLLMYIGYKEINVDNIDIDEEQKCFEFINRIKKDSKIIDKDINCFNSDNKIESTLYEFSKKIISIFKVLLNNNLLDDESMYDSLNNIIDPKIAEKLKIEDISYFLEIFRADLERFSVNYNSETINNDLSLSYKLVELNKTSDEKLKPEVCTYLASYLLNLLKKYELEMKEKDNNNKKIILK